ATFTDATVATTTASALAIGTTTLTWTISNGVCASSSDQVVITTYQAATVNAGTDQTICETGTATLSGSKGGSASSSTWSTSGDGSFNNASLLNAVYSPGTADIAANTVTLTLTTNNPAGPCNAVTDMVVISIDHLVVS